MQENKLVNGKIIQAIGPIVDIQFPENQLPALLTALLIKIQDLNWLSKLPSTLVMIPSVQWQ
jgi:F0F1-type ATP synthase beta subunit